MPIELDTSPENKAPASVASVGGNSPNGIRAKRKIVSEKANDDTAAATNNNSSSAPPPLIDPSKLELNSRILLKNKDDDTSTDLKEAIIKKLDLTQSPPKLRVHVDGRRKGILDTIGLDDIHSILGRRKNSIAPTTQQRQLVRAESSGVNDAVMNPPPPPAPAGTSLPSPITKPTPPELPQDSPSKPLISPTEYHKKFCIPRRKKRLRQFQRLTSQQNGGKQFNVPTSSFGGGNNMMMSRKNSSNSSETRMIMEDLILLQQQQLQEQQLQKQQQQQKEIYAQSIGAGGVGGMGYPYQDVFPSSLTPNSIRPLFGQGANNPMSAFGGGGGGANSNFLMPPPFQSGLSRGSDNRTKVSDAGGGKGGSLPQSAFSALDSLAPELRERMLRISKLAESKGNDDGKGDDDPAADDKEEEEDEKTAKGGKKRKRKKKGKKADEATSPKSARKKKKKAEEATSPKSARKEKKQKDKPTPTKKSKGKEKRAEAEEKSSVDDSSSDKRDADSLPNAMGRRMTDLTAQSGLSLASPNHDTIFGHRGSMIDGAAMSLGSRSSGGIRRDVLGPTALMQSVSAGFGGGSSSSASQMNMMQLMGINPPPFGGASIGSRDLRPPGQHYSDLSSSLESPNSPRRFISDGKNDKKASALASKEKGKEATLSPAKKSPKKVDADTSPAGARKKVGKKRKSPPAAKTKKAKKKKKAKKGKSKKSSKNNELVKPKRPFSAYNLFFQLEREFIMFIRSSGGDAFEDPLIKFAIETVEDANKEAEGKEGAEVKVVVDKDKMERELGSGEGINRDFDITEGIPSEGSKDDLPASISVPPRYKHLKLEDYWYCVARKVKRKHRKTEGSIGFVELTKMVSSRWKTVESTDPKVKAWCQNLADQQLVVYKKDVAEYKKWLESRPDSDDSEDESDDEDEEDDAATKVENVQDDRKVPEPSSVPTLPSLPSAPSGLGISPSMGLGISPHAFGRLQQSLVFDRRMADLSRFSDLTDPARMISHGMMMPPRPAPTLPPPPFQSSPSTGDRFNRLGGSRSIGMDDTERRFAALAEQESRRRIQTEMSMSSLPGQSFLGNGYGYGSMGMGGSLLGGNNRSIGGYSSMMPGMSQSDMSLSNEQMMAQIISLRNNLTHLGQQLPQQDFDLGGSQLPQRNFDLGGGKHLPQTNYDLGLGKQLPRQDFDLSVGKQLPTQTYGGKQLGKQLPTQNYAGKQLGKQLLEQIGFGGKGVENNDVGDS